MSTDHHTPPELESLLFEAIEKTPDGIAIFSPEDTLIYCNSTFASLSATTPERAVGSSFEAMSRHVYNSAEGIQIETQNLETWIDQTTVKRRRKDYRAFQTNVKDGRWFQVTEQLTEQGHIFAFAVDITEQKKVEKKYRLLADKFCYHADTDTLTDINNRRNFFRLAEKELLRCQRERKPSALLVIDVDHFKSVNDTHGHQFGDEVLRTIASRLSGELREYDILGRIGGEEFAMLIPGAATYAAGIAERIRSAIESPPIEAAGQALSVTLSVGGSLSDGEDNDLDLLISRADEARYAAKARGRNCVCFWRPEHSDS